MTGIASWLMVLSAVGPLLGAVVGLILVAGKPLHRISAASANIGILCGTVAAACLAVVIGPTDVTIVRLGTWIELTSPRRIQIDWSLQSDFSTALWVAVISGLAGLNVRSFKLTNTERQSAAFSAWCAFQR